MLEILCFFQGFLHRELPTHWSRKVFLKREFLVWKLMSLSWVCRLVSTHRRLLENRVQRLRLMIWRLAWKKKLKTMWLWLSSRTQRVRGQFKCEAVVTCKNSIIQAYRHFAWKITKRRIWIFSDSSRDRLQERRKGTIAGAYRENSILSWRSFH